MGLVMSSRKTIESFGVKRNPVDNESASQYRFLETWVDVDRFAREAQSYLLDKEDEYDLDAQYSMHVAERAMVIFTLFLEGDGRRFINMRASELIADCWLAGGGAQPPGKPEELRYMGINHIIEDASEESMKRELTQQLSQGLIKNPPTAPVEIPFGSPNWAANKWLRVCARVATEFSTPERNITVTRAWIVREGKCKGKVQFLHLVVEYTIKLEAEVVNSSPDRGEPSAGGASGE